MGRIRGAAAVAAALMLWCAGTAHAAESRWSQPRPVAASGVQPQAAIDDRGQVTVLWSEHLGPGRLMGAVRPPGASSFTAPFQVGDSSGLSRLVVMPNGEVAVFSWANTCPSSACQIWRVRFGPDLRRLGRQTTVASGGIGLAIAAAPNGRMMVAWLDGQGEGNVWAAERLPGASSFGVPVLIEPAGGGRYPGPPPSVAVNERGDAAVAYTRYSAGEVSGEVPMTKRIELRRAGDQFGYPQDLGTGGGGFFGPGLSLAPDGSTTAFFGQGAAVYRSRPAKGRFGPTVPLGGGAIEFGNLFSNAAGAAAALWWQHVPGTGDSPEHPYERAWYAALKPPGPVFGPTRRLDLPGSKVAPPSVGLDPLGNALIAWKDEDDGRLRAGVFGRLEPTASEVSPPLGQAPVTDVGLPASNAAGHAVEAFTEAGPGPAGTEGPVKIIERTPDTAGPGLVTSPLQSANGVVSARVRCSRPCEVGARILATRKARSARSRTVSLPAGRSGQVRLRLSAGQRRALIRRNARRVTIELRAVDSWGSRRTVRRKVSVKRLLGRRR